MTKVFVLIVLAVAAATGCRSGPDVTANISDPAAMRGVVLQHAPPASSVDDAIAFMQNEGFECEMVVDGILVQPHDGQAILLPRDYVGAAPLSPQTRAMLFGTCRVEEGVTFLRCRRVDSATEASRWAWDVDIVVKDDSVSDVVCHSGWGRNF